MGSTIEKDDWNLGEAVSDDDHAFVSREQLTPSRPAVPATPQPQRPDTQPATVEFAEGGPRAWLQVVGAWVIMANTWGLVNSYGVYQTYYERDLLKSNSSSDIAWIGSLQGALLMMLGSISGPLFDAGYFRHMLWLGLFLIVLGQFMTSLATTFYQVLLAQGVCIGLGCGMTFLPSTAIVSQYFQKRRALMVGIASTGSPIAGMIFPIIFGQLEPKIGFGWATRIIGFIVLAASAVPLAFLQTRVPASGQKRSLIDRSAMRDAPFLTFAVSSFFSFLGLYVAFFYIQLYAIRFQISSQDFSPYFVTLLNAGSIFGRLGPPYLGDKYGSMKVMMTVAIICMILSYAWIGIRNQAGLIAYALLYGCFSGSVVSMSPSAVVTLSPDMARVGTRMGMVFFLAGLAILAGSPIAGAILNDGREARWMATQAYAASSVLLGGVGYGIVILLSRKKRTMISQGSSG